MCGTVPENQVGSVNAQRDMDMVSRINRGLKPRYYIPASYKDEDGNIRSTRYKPTALLAALAEASGDKKGMSQQEKLDRIEENIRYSMSEKSQQYANKPGESFLKYGSLDKFLAKHNLALKKVQKAKDKLNEDN